MTGPYPYSGSEQDAWQRAAEDAIKQHDRDTRPELIFTNLRALSDQTNGGLRIKADGQDLLVEGDELNVRVRLGLRGGEMHIEEEDVGKG